MQTLFQGHRRSNISGPNPAKEKLLEKPFPKLGMPRPDEKSENLKNSAACTFNRQSDQHHIDHTNDEIHYIVYTVPISIFPQFIVFQILFFIDASLYFCSPHCC